MAGGTSNSFWPVTREDRPKQFLNIVGTNRSFLRVTYDHFAQIIPKENILVVTITRYGDLVRSQIPELPEENLLLEPYSRNTAPCMAYAAFTILKRNPNAVMIASPTDQIIMDVAEFKKSVLDIMDYAEEQDALVTLGIVPTKPATDFGYIQIQRKKGSQEKDKPLKVKTFTEKPDIELAKVFCKSGEFYWNSGIFAWKASVIKEEMERFIPDVVAVFNGWENCLGTDKERAFLEKTYADCHRISIDYGVMEKTERAWLYPGNFVWYDIDSWETLYNNLKKDSSGNVIFADNQLIANDFRNNMVMTTNSGKMYALKGLENYLIVDTGDVLMICPKDDKQFRDLFSSLGMPDYEVFR